MTTPLSFAARYRFLDEYLIRNYTEVLLLEKDLRVEADRYNQYMDRQRECGEAILRQDLPALFFGRLPGVPELVASCAGEKPTLYNSLCNASAFGFTFASLLQRRDLPAMAASRQAACSAALFNAGITLFDHVLDELHEENALFRLVDESYLGRMRAEGFGLLSCRVPEHSGDPVLRMLLLLIDAFYLSLGTPGPAGKFSEELHDTLHFMFLSEKLSVTRGSAGNEEDTRLLTRAMEIKSVTPFKAMGLMCLNAGTSGHDAEEEAIRAVCDKVGKIFWMVDDLADFPADGRRQLPNYVIQKLDIPAPGPDGGLTIKAAMEETLDDIVRQMNGMEELATAGLISAQTIAELRRFVVMYMNSWLLE